jgi:BolA family transcriptional regulator, general stress-responsive regulator
MPDPETIERMRQRLLVLEPLRLQLDDDSAMHAGHEGARSGGGHYRLQLVSTRFRGLSRVARHRLVYDALDSLMRGEIHALAMTLLTPEESAGAASPSRMSPEGT